YVYEPDTDSIDFAVTEAAAQNGQDGKRHCFWAEAKKGERDAVSMLTQLVLTCKKTYERGYILPPPFIGCFDSVKIAFLPFHDMLPIFSETDFNWNTAPSSHGTGDFRKAREKVAKLAGKNLAVYRFAADEQEIRAFIRGSLTPAAPAPKMPITEYNFTRIFIKWVREVRPSINMSKAEWAEFKDSGILDCDFYRADVMSSGGDTITEKLKIVLERDAYKLQETIKGRLFSTNIDFADGGDAYRRFWNKYERPPAEKYQQYIVDRRDLLVPQNIREVKGSFFTPKIWADKSKEYIAKVFGENWQDEYYVWDCAAGTGNLLSDLTNKYNVWASTLDQPDVDTMRSLIDIDENLNLLSGHVFQFDFLNDSFDKLPAELKKIIDDPEKRKKLLVYINPPDTEATNIKETTGTGKSRANVSASRIKDKYFNSLGSAARELAVQFLTRIYKELDGCKLGAFSKIKFINGQSFIKFRQFFRAEFKSGFAVHANTFDNVRGKFPIMFGVWDLNNAPFPQSVTVDIPEEHTVKTFWVNEGKTITDWIKQYDTAKGNIIAYIDKRGCDFQNNNQVHLMTKPRNNPKIYFNPINSSNLLVNCIYLAVRHCVEATWLNDRDQFYYPNDGWKTDAEFQNDCLIFALFHSQNRIQSRHGVNHWLPFAETEVDAKDKFESDFMSSFLKGRAFSAEAAAVNDAGRELWRYYHAKAKTDTSAPVNASYYDIREYFQGRTENGAMNARATDETYCRLIKNLRDALRTLAKKLAPKTYVYGFLKA
uniref:hypothetical protein n=1 Tax=Treponema endosymbiont of Eucomonympha sp. TaxID=1580831 RepID=UPI0007510893